MVAQSSGPYARQPRPLQTALAVLALMYLCGTNPASGADPMCASGLIDGSNCCPKSCGACGGSGCGSLPGGAESCCSSGITKAGLTCTDSDPPCIIMPPAAAPDPTCETGIASGYNCCPMSCGKCGGEGCSALPGGATSCCTGSVGSGARPCSENAPPCVMDITADPECKTGVSNGKLCCASTCGTCGGAMCHLLPGGGGDCCKKPIEDSARSCLLNPPPCVMPPSDPTCATGIKNGHHCCAKSCGKCGFAGCGDLPGGSADCCTAAIKTAARSCEFFPPPCMMTKEAPGSPDPTCATGLRAADADTGLPYGKGYLGKYRNICCAKECGQCGGDTCSSQEGGADKCCKTNIAASARSCSLNPPPCVLMPKLGGDSCTSDDECLSLACVSGQCECSTDIPCLFGTCVSPNATAVNVCRAKLGELCSEDMQCASKSCSKYGACVLAEA